MPYISLNHALKLFRQQVIESIPYALEEFPPFSTPEAAFNYLKARTTYKKDPRTRELFQCLPTLMENNFHGIVGAGDCDCFTIAALAVLAANGFETGIVLAGRKPAPFNPVHIYAYVMDNGERKIFDLTNASYGYERFYPYKQSIPLKLSKEEKNMMLQLADGPGGQPGYIYFPRKRVQVREDYFDGMSAGEFQQMCLNEGVEIPQLEELSSRRSQRKADNEAVRNQKRMNKAAAKGARKMAKPHNQKKLIKAENKAEVRTSRQLRRSTRAVDPSRGKIAGQLFKTIGGVTQAVLSPGSGGASNYQSPSYQQPDEDEEDSAPDNTFSPYQDYEQDQEDYTYQPEEDEPMEEGGYKPLLVAASIAVAGYFVGASLKKVKTRRRMAA